MYPPASLPQDVAIFPTRFGEDLPRNRAVPYPTNMVERDVTRYGLTIREAATLLGVHPNTVRNRIKDGTYRAEKILTTNGPKYYIDRDSLVDNSDEQRLPHASQQGVNTPNLAEINKLVTQVVEAIGKDPDKERRVEADKVRVQVMQTQVLVSAALIAAMGALLTFMPEPQYLLVIYIAFVCLLGSVVTALNFMRRVAYEIQNPTRGEHPTAPGWYFIAALYLVGGLVCCMLFIGLNAA